MKTYAIKSWYQGGYYITKNGLQITGVMNRKEARQQLKAIRKESK